MRRNMQTTKGQPGHILVNEVTRYITAVYRMKQIRVKRNYVCVYITNYLHFIAMFLSF